MKLLLDTHTLLWWWGDDPLLSATARKAIANEANTVLVSAASAWEIAIKYRLGKLPGGADALGRFSELVAADGFTHLQISHLHAIRSGGLAVNHKDPFDRMLAAQANIENATLVTIDQAFREFQTKILW
jgi:PIN domain nuclease of toxin-antitoxin system